MSVTKKSIAHVLTALINNTVDEIQRNSHSIGKASKHSIISDHVANFIENNFNENGEWKADAQSAPWPQQEVHRKDELGLIQNRLSRCEQQLKSLREVVAEHGMYLNPRQHFHAQPVYGEVGIRPGIFGQLPASPFGQVQADQLGAINPGLAASYGGSAYRVFLETTPPFFKEDETYIGSLRTNGMEYHVTISALHKAYLVYECGRNGTLYRVAPLHAISSILQEDIARVLGVKPDFSGKHIEVDSSKWGDRPNFIDPSETFIGTGVVNGYRVYLTQAGGNAMAYQCTEDDNLISKVPLDTLPLFIQAEIAEKFDLAKYGIAFSYTTNSTPPESPVREG